MSSLAEKVEREQKRIFHENEPKNIQKATFTINLPNTTLTIKRSLTYLEDINSQDIFNWKTEFMETKTICN